MASWDHAVRRLTDAVIDRYDRFGQKCATGKCKGLPTHRTSWRYVTGRQGRVSRAGRDVCTSHGEKFALKHGLVIGDPRPERQTAVAAAVASMEAGPTTRVRVHRARNSGPWYLERRHVGTGLFEVSNQWMSGVLVDASIEEAIVEATRMLADHEQVPAGQWEHGDGEAAVNVIAAVRSNWWHEQPWQMRIACDEAGMWQLTRTLAADVFPPRVDSLGNHNMNLERALRVAAAQLADTGWVTFGDWSTYPYGTAENGGWHPDQVHEPTTRPAATP